MRFLAVGLALFCSVQLIAQKASAPDLPGALRVQLGFNFLSDNPDDMSTGWWGSKGFNAHYLYSVRLGESPLSFNPGFGIGTDKFSFDKDVTLIRNPDGTVSMIPLDEADFGNVKKSKLAVTYLEIPIEFRYHFKKDNFKKSIKLAVGGKVGLLLSSHAKIKHKNFGENLTLKSKDNFNLTRFRYGLQASLGIAGVGAYFYYGLNDMFEKDKGPEATKASQMQAGLLISVF